MVVFSKMLKPMAFGAIVCEQGLTVQGLQFSQQQKEHVTQQVTEHGCDGSKPASSPARKTTQPRAKKNSCAQKNSCGLVPNGTGIGSRFG